MYVDRLLVADAKRAILKVDKRRAKNRNYHAYNRCRRRLDVAAL